MCIISAKAAGVKMPGEETIYNMWRNNPDGAGLMYADGGKVHIRKGFMEYDSFTDELERLSNKYDLTELPLVMHFRITTHGGTKPENCHPFPVSSSIGTLKKLSIDTDLGVAHNGIINVTPRKDISDTMEYIAGQMAPLKRAVPNFYKNKNLMKMVEHAIDSKMALLAPDGKIYTIGKFEEDEGILYSNYTYSYLKGWKPSTYGCYSGTDYEVYSDLYDYKVKEVMWLTDDESVEDVDGGWWSGEGFAMDENGLLYTYEGSEDAIIPVYMSTAYAKNGELLEFDKESPNVTQEYILMI